MAEETGDAEYRRVVERAIQWTIAHDFREATPISFKENPAGAVFYTFEFYATAITLVKPGTPERNTALAQVAAAAQWWTENQQGRDAKSSLNYLGDATYMGGMPYLMYSLARQLPARRDLPRSGPRIALSGRSAVEERGALAQQHLCLGVDDLDHGLLRREAQSRLTVPQQQVVRNQQKEPQKDEVRNVGTKPSVLHTSAVPCSSICGSLLFDCRFFVRVDAKFRERFCQCRGAS